MAEPDAFMLAGRLPWYVFTAASRVRLCPLDQADSIIDMRTAQGFLLPEKSIESVEAYISAGGGAATQQGAHDAARTNHR